MDYSQLRATVKKYAGCKGEPGKLLVDFSTILNLLRDLDVANRTIELADNGAWTIPEARQQASREIGEKGDDD